MNVDKTIKIKLLEFVNCNQKLYKLKALDYLLINFREMGMIDFICRVHK